MLHQTRRCEGRIVCLQQRGACRGVCGPPRQKHWEQTWGGARLPRPPYPPPLGRHACGWGSRRRMPRPTWGPALCRRRIGSAWAPRPYCVPWEDEAGQHCPFETPFSWRWHSCWGGIPHAQQMAGFLQSSQGCPLPAGLQASAPAPHPDPPAKGARPLGGGCPPCPLLPTSLPWHCLLPSWFSKPSSVRTWPSRPGFQGGRLCASQRRT